MLLSIACGLGALIALDRRDRRRRRGRLHASLPRGRDLLGRPHLCLRSSRRWCFSAANHWRRIWVPVVPALLYLAWWLWARDSAGELRATTHDLRRAARAELGISVPRAVTLASLTGPPLSGASGGGAARWRRATVLADRRPRRVRLALQAGSDSPQPIWTMIALLLSLWALQVVAPSVQRLPSSPRYLFPVAVAVLLVGAEAVRGKSLVPHGADHPLRGRRLRAGDEPRSCLHDSGAQLPRDLRRPSCAGSSPESSWPATRASPDYIPRSAAAHATRLDAVFAAFAAKGMPPTGTYLAAVRAYGRLGYPRQELHSSQPGRGSRSSEPRSAPRCGER